MIIEKYLTPNKFSRPGRKAQTRCVTRGELMLLVGIVSVIVGALIIFL